MNILFVCHRLPFPPNRGGKIRPFNMIRHLSQRHHVTVASLAESEQELENGSGLQQYCTEVIAEVVPVSRRWLRAALALPTHMPSSAAYFWSPHLYRQIQKMSVEKKWDVVLVHCAFVAEYVLDLHPRLKILDFGDLDSAKWSDYAIHRSAPLSFGYALEARKLRRYEKKLARQFDSYLVTAQRELEEFATLQASAPCTVVPNGVDMEYFGAARDVVPSAPVIAFIGRMDYFPNIDGVLYFVRNMFPLIRRVIPQAEFRIVGANPTRQIDRLARIPGISVTGYVPDIRPHLRDARVVVAPLRIARGTQNKVLESMAMGIPVVATPEAAKGVQATPSEHLLVAQEPALFAQHVVEVLRENDRHNCLSRAAYQQIGKAHDWQRSMQLLDSVLQLS